MQTRVYRAVSPRRDIGRLLPGLADMLVHYWTPGESALFMANGVTLVRNMAGAPLHFELLRQIQQREIPCPHMVGRD